MAIPGFWSCGFRPRPSAGIQSSRSYGLAPNAVVARKKTSVAASVPVTYGISARLRPWLVATQTVE